MMRNKLATMVAVAAAMGLAPASAPAQQAATTTETGGAVVVRGVEVPYRLTMPEHPRGAILLVPGSLGSDVDGNYPAMGLAPHAYADLARQLGAQGYVVLRMAKIGPGTGSRTIDPAQAAIHGTFRTRVEVAEAGWRALPKVPGPRVIAGHSEGALVAFLLAAQAGIEADGVVSLSGPSQSIYTIMRDQVAALNAKPGLTPDLSAFDAAIAAFRAGKTLPSGLTTNPQTVMLASMPVAAIAYLNSVDREDVLKAVADVRQPMLIVSGGRDFSVPAHHADALALARARQGLPTERAFFAELTHFYKHAPADLAPMRAMALSSDSDPAVAEAIAHWAERLGSRRRTIGK